MNKLSVNYLGLSLKSPLIASSSGLTSNVETIKDIENAGAGAVVLKSLYEEQIIDKSTTAQESSSYSAELDYISTYIKEDAINSYLTLIKEAKRECEIPIIASISCVKGGEWVPFAKKMAEAGADALELNIIYSPLSPQQRACDIEESYLQTIASVIEVVDIPVAIKLCNNFTNPLNIISEIYFRKAKGVVLFNRLLEPNIDIDTMTIKESHWQSTSNDIRHTLRWLSLANKTVPNIDYSASTGVHSASDAIKMILAGATTVQLCTVLYEKGVNEIEVMNRDICDWMDRFNYDRIEQFRGNI